MYFHERKALCVNSNFTEFCYRWFSLQYVGTGPGNGSVPTKQQVIAWTNVEEVSWCHIMSQDQIEKIVYWKLVSVIAKVRYIDVIWTSLHLRSLNQLVFFPEVQWYTMYCNKSWDSYITRKFVKIHIISLKYTFIILRLLLRNSMDIWIM